MHNFTPEMIDSIKTTNEKLHHVFGYVKTDDKSNRTPFLDYEGKASNASLSKLDQYKQLNERAFEKRMKIKHGDLPDEKI